MIDCNGNDVTQKSKDFIDNLEEGLIKSERQFENCDRCKQKFSEIDKIRAEIENHSGLIKEDHCKYCSYCNSVMGIREILEVIDKYKAESEER